MKLSVAQTSQLVTALNVCKVMGIEGVMVSDSKIRGARASLDSAIISELELGLPSEINIGIGRVDELLKRLKIYESPVVDISANDRNDATVLTVSAGRSKMQYRCTASSLLRYPKSNDDTVGTNVYLSPEEAKLVVRGVQSLSAEFVVIQVTRAGVVKIEAADGSNTDRFDVELEEKADLENGESTVLTYKADLFLKALSSVAQGDSRITLQLGESGSLLLNVHGHNVMIFAEVGEDNYDD